MDTTPSHGRVDSGHAALGERLNLEVFLDARVFSCPRVTGIARYSARLAMALSQHATVRFFVERQELIPQHDLSWDMDQDLRAWTAKVWGGKLVPLPRLAEPCLAIYPAIRPMERIFPFEISVLFDFTPLLLPSTHTRQTRHEFGELFESTIQRSDLAVAISRATQADAEWLCALPSERVVFAPTGPSLCVRRHLHARPVERSPRMGVVVSTLEPRKNARFLLDWFATTTEIEGPMELCWCGPMGWLTSRRELRAYRSLKHGRKVRFLGTVSDQELCGIYQRAGWSAYPSLYEGFGFPVLDALRHGVPCMISANSSLIEFEGPGVHFFDPVDPSTCDQAWRDMHQADQPALDPERLDRVFNWDLNARVILDAWRQLRSGSAGHPGMPRGRGDDRRSALERSA